jgi:hypothetical protein
MSKSLQDQLEYIKVIVDKSILTVFQIICLK